MEGIHLQKLIQFHLMKNECQVESYCISNGFTTAFFFVTMIDRKKVRICQRRA
ncbi:hypothetical protein HMPREF0833_11770 [Streptococcus parasanguinis ATCC 15912]|uniref:Uncharacterized protein n=1 Tax=Streptococcus parasanguinis (strain ATCC 15912 / DSM 6778 / CIP 104372 / LMG 14537) TaxID=760570 RepID=F8DHH0_STREP|nr:hypothetical protein HMPREF0833_11770 [Streptococcus parasanguinis ATCC 15912]